MTIQFLRSKLLWAVLALAANLAVSSSAQAQYFGIGGGPSFGGGFYGSGFNRGGLSIGIGSGYGSGLGYYGGGRGYYGSGLGGYYGSGLGGYYGGGYGNRYYGNSYYNGGYGGRGYSSYRPALRSYQSMRSYQPQYSYSSPVYSSGGGYHSHHETYVSGSEADCGCNSHESPVYSSEVIYSAEPVQTSYSSDCGCGD